MKTTLEFKWYRRLTDSSKCPYAIEVCHDLFPAISLWLRNYGYDVIAGVDMTGGACLRIYRDIREWYIHPNDYLSIHKKQSEKTLDYGIKTYSHNEFITNHKDTGAKPYCIEVDVDDEIATSITRSVEIVVKAKHVSIASHLRFSYDASNLIVKFTEDDIIEEIEQVLLKALGRIRSNIKKGIKQ
jgi:hypothetical protein